jgi:hypothetical protein
LFQQFQRQIQQRFDGVSGSGHGTGTGISRAPIGNF